MRLFNTLSRAEEEFRPLDPAGRRVTLYCCGPTVYNFAHIGNFRTFAFEDLLRRHLEARGYEVVHVAPEENYAANCVRVNDHVLMATGYPKLEAAVRGLGYAVIALDMSEYQKMDGGLSCLSLRF